MGDRVQLAGAVGDEELLTLYAGALGVVYTPYDEDFGYVTLEAFLARKPVITARDSGGTLEFVAGRRQRLGLRARRPSRWPTRSRSWPATPARAAAWATPVTSARGWSPGTA